MELFLYGFFVPACVVLAALRVFQGGILRNIALFFPLIALANVLGLVGVVPIWQNVLYSGGIALVMCGLSWAGHLVLERYG